MPRVHQTQKGAYVTVDGKRLRVEYDTAAAAELKAGMTVTVNVDGQIEFDEQSDTSTDEEEEKDKNESVAYGIVAQDQERNIHGENVSLFWFYDKDELPMASPPLKRGQKVLCTTPAIINASCICDFSDTLSLLPENIFNGLYNQPRKQVQHKDEALSFLQVEQMLQVRIVARRKLRALPNGVQSVHANQAAIAAELLQKAVHIFANVGAKQTLVVDAAQTSAAWMICFGPLLVGSALAALVELCTFSKHT